MLGLNFIKIAAMTKNSLVTSDANRRPAQRLNRVRIINKGRLKRSFQMHLVEHMECVYADVQDTPDMGRWCVSLVSLFSNGWLRVLV